MGIGCSQQPTEYRLNIEAYLGHPEHRLSALHAQLRNHQARCGRPAQLDRPALCRRIDRIQRRTVLHLAHNVAMHCGQPCHPDAGQSAAQQHIRPGHLAQCGARLDLERSALSAIELEQRQIAAGIAADQATVEVVAAAKRVRHAGDGERHARDDDARMEVLGGRVVEAEVALNRTGADDVDVGQRYAVRDPGFRDLQIGWNWVRGGQQENVCIEINFLKVARSHRKAFMKLSLIHHIQWTNLRIAKSLTILRLGGALHHHVLRPVDHRAILAGRHVIAAIVVHGAILQHHQIGSQCVSTPATTSTLPAEPSDRTVCARSGSDAATGAAPEHPRWATAATRSRHTDRRRGNRSAGAR